MGLNHKVTHVGLGLDASWSMADLENTLITTVDEYIADLARQSRDMNQEVRVSVYSFGGRDNIKNLCWDMDVLRFDTIRGLYKVGGRTALLDCTHLMLDDFAKIPVMYDDHASLVCMWSDGMENDSIKGSPTQMNLKINSQPSHVSVAAFVPDQKAEDYSVSAGFPRENIVKWNATSTKGVEDVGKLIKSATSSILQSRAQGVRSFRSGLFTLNTVSTDQIKKNLTPLSPSSYSMLRFEGPNTVEIKDLVNSRLPVSYQRGFGYYELVKHEHIQPSKAVAIEQNGSIYVGNARDMLGLPDETVKIGPDWNAGYKIFVQSGSVNRKVIPGQRILYLTGNSLSHLSRSF